LAARSTGHLKTMRVLPQRNGFLAAGAVLTAGALLVAGLDEDAASQARAGACVDKEAQPAACTDAAGVYQVLTTVDGDRSGCPDGDYVEKRSDAGLLCLGYNAAAGDCVQDDPTGPMLVRCTTDTQTPTIRILKVVEDKATAKACRSLDGDAVLALTYSAPAKTLCIVHQPIAPAMA
jgi:hypothetical protein